jgi:NADPH-dependent ferric siderophore reductase
MNQAGLLHILQSLVPEIQGADPAACPALIAALEQLKAELWMRMTHAHVVAPKSTMQIDNGKYLTVTEAAERFHVTPQWLYRHKKKLPYSQPSRKVLLFPESAIQKWFASRKAN